MAERKRQADEEVSSVTTPENIVNNNNSNINNGDLVREVEVSSSDDDEYDFSNEPEHFQCETCPSRFVTRVSLARHMIVHEHETEIGSQIVRLNFVCSFCNLGFKKGEDLADHVSKEHGGAHFGCPHCSRNFSRKDHLNKHIANVHFADNEANNFHEAENGYNNQIEDGNEDYDDIEEGGDEDDEGYLNCNMEMTEEYQDPEDYLETSYLEQEDDDEQSRDTENSNDNVEFGTARASASNDIHNGFDSKSQCPECGAIFMTRENMRRHLNNHFSKRDYMCDMCGRGFARKEHLTKHLGSVHSGVKFTCSFCGKDISRKDHLIRHIRNVHPTEFSGIPEELPLNMMQNAYVSTYNSTLDKAIQSLQPKPKKPFLTCDMCESTFTNLNCLHEHQATVHSDVRKFRCEYCVKAFKRKEHLTKHMVIHTGSKDHPCKICFKEFPRRDALNDHIRRIHGQKQSSTSTNNNISVETHPCDFCSKVFSSRKNLIAHMKSHGLIVSFPKDKVNAVADEEEDVDTNYSSPYGRFSNFNMTENVIEISDGNPTWKKSVKKASATATTTTTLYV